MRIQQKQGYGLDDHLPDSIAMTPEDIWGGDISTTMTDFNNYQYVRLAEDAPSGFNGMLNAPAGTG